MPPLREPFLRATAAEARAEWRELWQSSPMHKEIFEKASADFHEHLKQSRMPVPIKKGSSVTISSIPIPSTLARRARRLLEGNGTFPDPSEISPEVLVGAAPLGGGPISGIRAHKRPSGKMSFEDKQFMAATCFFDVWQGLQYVAYAGLGIYYITLGGGELTEASSWLNVIATFNWIGSFLAAAAGDCKVGLNPSAGSGCASSVMWLVGNIPQLAADAIGVYQECPNFNAPNRRLATDETYSEERGTQRHRDGRAKELQRADEVRANASVPRRLRVSNGAPGSASRDASITSCFFDVNAAISFFARFGLQIKTEQTDCQDSKIGTSAGRTNCAMGVLYTIQNFGWAAEYVMQLFADCPEYGWDNQVYCLEDATDLAWSGTGMTEAVDWTMEYCNEVVAAGGPSADAKKDLSRPVPGLYGDFGEERHHKGWLR